MFQVLIASGMIWLDVVFSNDREPVYKYVCVVNTGKKSDNIGGFFVTRKTNFCCHVEADRLHTCR